MNKAILLDRDGVINNERGDYVYLPEDFVILPDTIPALKVLQELGFLLIIISNQSGIAKGRYTIEDVENLHKPLLIKLEENGVYIKEIYYCPHHPDYSNCICRKPDSQLVEKAIARFDIDIERSYFIGDKERDTLAGKKAGVRGILIDSNFSLLKAIEPIVEEETKRGK